MCIIDISEICGSVYLPIGQWPKFFKQKFQTASQTQVEDVAVSSKVEQL